MSKGIALLWLALVLAAVFHVGWVARDGMPLDSDLMALLPREERDPAVRRAKDRMAETLSRRLVVMVGHADRAVARTQATRLRRDLLAAGLVQPGSDVADAQSLRRLGAAYFPHRAALLSEADQRLLAAGEARPLLDRALAQVYGFAGAVESRLLTQDPLLLFPAFLSALPGPANRLIVDDGLLSVTEDGMVWVMVAMVLLGEPSSLELQGHVGRIYDAVVASAPAGTRWLRLGALFYAQAGAEQGMRESARIGMVSLIGTIMLVGVVFRSFQPLLLSMLAIGVGLTVALSACLMWFGSLHVAAQLFGATLIGVTVDYALHYYGQVFAAGIAARDRLPRVRNGLLLGAATTVVGYAALALSPFPGLRQVAVFSTVGLLGALATVMLWFPLLDRTPERSLPGVVARWADRWRDFMAAPRWRGARQGAILALALLAVFGALRLEPDDDVRRQQGLSPRLADEQAEIQRLAGLGLTGQFFLVQGQSEQQVLEREEELGLRLSSLADWQAVARYVPSARRQLENAALVRQRLYDPHLAAYDASLGMIGAEPPPPAPHALRPAEILATGALPFLDALVVDPTLHVVTLDRVTDPNAVARAADGLDGVRFVDPTADLSTLLTAYRQRAVLVLVLSVAAMLPLLSWRYGRRRALRVMAAPLLAVAMTPPLLALAGIGFSFFAAMALILVLSIGTDYAVFHAEEHGCHGVTVLSVGLAMLTTVLSFGLLVVSDLAGVRAFGATMLLGVILCFLFSPMAGRAADGTQ